MTVTPFLSSDFEEMRASRRAASHHARVAMVGLDALLLLAVTSLGLAEAEMKTFEIAPGVHMPWISNGAVGYPSNATETAAELLWLENGGRGLDTAWSYNNQAQVGAAIGHTTVKRSEIFLTTKIPCLGTAELALERVRTDQAQLCDGGASTWCKDQPFADLVLIHEPGGGCKSPAMQQSTWKGLEMAVAQNLTRSIGVSNFGVKDLEAILATAHLPPAVNQCSMHIGRHDDLTIEFCKSHNIQYEAYSPLGGPDLGGQSVMAYPQVISIAKAHEVSGAQVALRWVLQQDIAVVTATGNKEFILEDLAVTNFTLTAAEMKTLSAVAGKPPQPVVNASAATGSAGCPDRSMGTPPGTIPWQCASADDTPSACPPTCPAKPRTYCNVCGCGGVFSSEYCALDGQCVTTSHGGCSRQGGTYCGAASCH